MLSVIIVSIPAILIRWVFVRKPLSKLMAVLISLFLGVAVSIILEQVYKIRWSTLGGTTMIMTFVILIWKKDDQASDDKKIESPKKDSLLNKILWGINGKPKQ